MKSTKKENRSMNFYHSPLRRSKPFLVSRLLVLVSWLNFLEKEKILKRSIQKYAEENKQLFEESLNESGKNRASTILALHREMEQQDLVIEILRKLINDDKLLKSAIPSRMKGKIDKVTPKSREELRMEIRELDTKIEVLKGKYLRDFPQKQPDFYSDKQQQTEQIEISKNSLFAHLSQFFVFESISIF